MSVGRPIAIAVVVLAACSSPQTEETSTVLPPPADPPAVVAQAPAVPPNPWSERLLPFEPSDDDRASLGTGFTGYRAVPEETGFTQGVNVAGVQPGGALSHAGLQDGDVIVSIAGTVLDRPRDELINQLREILKPLKPDTLTTLRYFRADVGITDVEFWLGRSPPAFARLETPSRAFLPARGGPRPVDLRDPHVEEWIAAATALDDGEARLADTVARQKKRFAKQDVFRLSETIVAQLHPSAHERLADALLRRLAARPVDAAAIGAGREWMPHESRPTPEFEMSWESRLDDLEAFLVPRAEWLRDELADWSPEERTWLTESLPTLTEQAIVNAEYLYGDDDVERERTNRRILALLERVDRDGLARVADEVERFVVSRVNPLLELAYIEDRSGLLASRDTSMGRIEIWGGGNQRHKQRCLFRLDVRGDDNYLDTAGRADLDHPLSINVDAEGNDLYGATTTFCQGAAFGGIGMLHDLEGDDQYLARQWCQGAAVAGVGWLLDTAGNDTYRGREACQGVALVGGGTLSDGSGDDTYSGDRFCQGVGFAAGVGALLDRSGDDRYSCTGKYGSEYGEDGLFSGWGQGVGFGFRRVTSGGIGMLHDGSGDDRYEAGNFSQGGAYFYAWGILRDDSGNDRYVGSRYAQGYAAHQAAGTFIDGAGDDLYQSHSSVAQGLSWDETTVFFRDRGGNDRYETKGFSLASAAHNAMVVFIDDAGDDHYAELPAKASSNNYHGGHSFALFVDRGGNDRYEGKNDAKWNGRVFWRHDGAYVFDLDGDRPIEELIRTPEKKD